MKGPDPYAAPRATAPGFPAVIAWYRAYTATMAVLYLLACGAGAMLLVDTRGVAVLVALLALAAFHAAAAIVPRRPWAWTVGLATIAFGVAGCTIVFAAPLLYYWTKPVTKAAFGRGPL